MYYIRKTNTETDSILNELQQTYKEPVSDSLYKKTVCLTEEWSILKQTLPWLLTVPYCQAFSL